MQGISEDKREEGIERSNKAEFAEYIRNELLYKLTKEDIRCGKRNKELLEKTTTTYPGSDDKGDER